MTEPSNGAPSPRCPVCATEIDADATRCSQCGALLPSAAGTYFFDFGTVVAPTGSSPKTADMKDDTFAAYAARGAGHRRAAAAPGAWNDEDFARISKSAGSHAGEPTEDKGPTPSPAMEPRRQNPPHPKVPEPEPEFVSARAEPATVQEEQENRLGPMSRPRRARAEGPSAWTRWRQRRREKSEIVARSRRERRDRRRRRERDIAAAHLRERKEAASRRRKEKRDMRRLARTAAAERRRERLAAGRRQRSEAAERLRRQQQEGEERRRLERVAVRRRRDEARRAARANRRERRARAAQTRRAAVTRLSRASSAGLAGLAVAVGNTARHLATKTTAGAALGTAALLRGSAAPARSMPRIGSRVAAVALLLLGGAVVYGEITRRNPAGLAALPPAMASLSGASGPAPDAASHETVPSMPPATETRLALEEPSSVPIPLPRIKHHASRAKIATTNTDESLWTRWRSRGTVESYTRSALLPAAAERDGGRRRLETRIAGVQTRLRHLGYPAGPSTGVFNTDTQRAILLYQIDNDLPRTGEIDARLLRRLHTEGDGEWQTATDWSAPRR